MNPTKLAKLITARNEAFKSSTPAEKRILIAEDVLARVKSKTYNPWSGSWVMTEIDINASKSLQKALLCNDIQCDCCALGGLMLSNVSYQNNIETNRAEEYLTFSAIAPKPEWTDEVPIEDKSKFLKLFSRKQLALIEYTFERGCGMYCEKDLFDMGISDTMIRKANIFRGGSDKHGEYEFNNKQLLVMIMENIVANKGMFKP